jgi:hypothetical protein
MLNLTPHTIRIFARTHTGAVDLETFVDVPPSGTIARVEMLEEERRALPVTNAIAATQNAFGGGSFWNVPVISRTPGKVVGLPEDTNQTVLVSSMILEAVPGRPNTFAPDTGVTAVRNEKGNVVGVIRLVAA